VCNEERRVTYCSPNNITAVIQSNRMRYCACGVYGGTRFVMGKPERHVFLDLGVDGNIRLKCTLKKEYGRA